MKTGAILNSLLVALAITGLAACGGGSGGSITPPPPPPPPPSSSTVVGSIGGFGSIIMSNGVEYETDGVTTCEVDDSSAAGTCEDSLAVGMSISMVVNGSGEATSVKYDDELEGPTAGVTGSAGNFSFTVFGVDVTTTNPGTQWRDFATSPPLLAELDGANVEISGEWNGTTLNALFVELQNDTSHEAKGTVGMVSGSIFPLTLQDGTVLTVDATGASLVPADGDFVEVEGNYDGTTFFATKVELEDGDDFADDGEAEITGTLVQDGASSTGFSIGNTDVDFTNAPTCEALVGKKVEGKGTYDQATSVLTLATCEDEDDALEMKCIAGAVVVDAANSKVGSVECTFPGTTGGPLPIEFHASPDLAVFVDDSTLNPFNLNGISTGGCIEIKASTDASVTPAVHVAGFVERESVASACSNYKLEGTVESFNTGADITVLGITYSVGVNTAFPEGPPTAGTDVKILDDNGDGTADTVRID